MSISSAFNSATSGLKATSKLASTISSNVSNALTAGYAKRTTELSSVTAGGVGTGVRIGATTRTESPYLTSERRLAQSAEAATSARSDAYSRLMEKMGEAGVSGSLSANGTALETALMAAVASPQSTTLQTNTVDTARNLVASINGIAKEASAVRTEADAEIARQVATVNDTLNKVQVLNQKITNLTLQGVDTLSLQDERGQLIDGISAIIPVRTVNRDGGAVSIYSQNGAALLDGSVWELSFDAAPTTVTSDMTLAGGQLGALKQDQGAFLGLVTVATGTGTGPMDGGSLAALFQVRDSIVPEFTGELDRFSNDLIERFRDLMPASTLDASGNGLFVDPAGTGTDGLASRISVNAAVDPDQGGAVWRLRDGLGATVEGASGNGAILQAMSDAMAEKRDPIGFVSQSAQNDSSTMASEISAYFSGKSARSDDDLSFLNARASTLVEQETNYTGVDSDSELQYLTVVQQAYVANAKVLTTIDTLMQTLLDI